MRIGAYVMHYINVLGEFVLFTVYAFFKSLGKPYYIKLVLSHLVNIGFFSIPMLSMTALFSGGVLALQSYASLSRFAAESTIPTVVVLSMTRELGPVMSGLMLSARVGSSIAAQIATMRVTEQIDAMRTLATDPIKYLVTPRIIATILVMPILVLIVDIIGIIGGYLVSIFYLEFNSYSYLLSTFKHLKSQDMISGLIKSFMFGFVISSTSCYYGYHAAGGARGVGVATIGGVVTSSIVILVSNYVVTYITL